MRGTAAKKKYGGDNETIDGDSSADCIDGGD